MTTLEKMVSVVTGDLDSWLVPLEDACDRFDINNEDRQAMFLANCAHESNKFRQLSESLHYSAARLLAVFPSRITPAEAIDFQYDDRRIAERVYGGRMGNAPEGSGDGYAFRGRGLLQVTGRGMYSKCGRSLGVDLETLPELLEQPIYAALSAAWVWSIEKMCNTLADDGKFQSVVLRINGGLNGINDRLAWLDRIRNA